MYYIIALKWDYIIINGLAISYIPIFEPVLVKKIYSRMLAAITIGSLHSTSEPLLSGQVATSFFIEPINLVMMIKACSLNLLLMLL